MATGCLERGDARPDCALGFGGDKVLTAGCLEREDERPDCMLENTKACGTRPSRRTNARPTRVVLIDFRCRAIKGAATTGFRLIPTGPAVISFVKHTRRPFESRASGKSRSEERQVFEACPSNSTHVVRQRRRWRPKESTTLAVISSETLVREEMSNGRLHNATKIAIYTASLKNTVKSSANRPPLTRGSELGFCRIVTQLLLSTFPCPLFESQFQIQLAVSPHMGSALDDSNLARMRGSIL